MKRLWFLLFGLVAVLPIQAQTVYSSNTFVSTLYVPNGGSITINPGVEVIVTGSMIVFGSINAPEGAITYTGGGTFNLSPVAPAKIDLETFNIERSANTTVTMSGTGFITVKNLRTGNDGSYATWAGGSTQHQGRIIIGRNIRVTGLLRVIGSSGFEGNGYIELVNGRLAEMGTAGTLDNVHFQWDYMDAENGSLASTQNPGSAGKFVHISSPFDAQRENGYPASYGKLNWYQAGNHSPNPSQVAVWGWDETALTSPSSDGWYGTHAVSGEPINRGRGYTAYQFSEDEQSGFGLSATDENMSDNPQLRVSGSITSTSFNFPVLTNQNAGNPDEGWNFLGNPFPGTLDWTSPSGWSRNNVLGFAVFDYIEGNYQYVSGDGLVWTSWPNGDAGSIKPGQGFFAYTDNTGGSLTVSTEALSPDADNAHKSGAVPLDNLPHVALSPNYDMSEAVFLYHKPWGTSKTELGAEDAMHIEPEKPGAVSLGIHYRNTNDCMALQGIDVHFGGSAYFTSPFEVLRQHKIPVYMGAAGQGLTHIYLEDRGMGTKCRSLFFQDVDGVYHGFKGGSLHMEVNVADPVSFVGYIVTRDEPGTGKVELPVSTESVPMPTSVQVYPNPASEVIHVEGTFDLVEILDLTGRMIEKGSAENILVADLAPGVYLIRISGNGQTLHTERIIIE